MNMAGITSSVKASAIPQMQTVAPTMAASAYQQMADALGMSSTETAHHREHHHAGSAAETSDATSASPAASATPGALKIVA